MKLKQWKIEALGGKLKVTFFNETDGNFLATITGERMSHAQVKEPGKQVSEMNINSYGPITLSAKKETEIESMIKSRLEAEFGRIFRIEVVP